MTTRSSSNPNIPKIHSGRRSNGLIIYSMPARKRWDENTVPSRCMIPSLVEKNAKVLFNK